MAFWDDWDIDIDSTSMGVTIIVVALFAVFLLADPLHVGMDRTPLASRIIAIAIMIPLGYFIVERMSNR